MPKIFAPKFKYSLNKKYGHNGCQYGLCCSISFNGRIEKSMNIAVATDNQWDSTAQQFTRKMPNYRSLNETLASYRVKFDEIINSYIKNNRPFIASNIMNEVFDAPSYNLSLLSDIDKKMCRDLRLSYKNANLHQIVFNQLTAYCEKEDITIQEFIQNDFLIGFFDEKSKTIKNNTLLTYSSIIFSIINYCIGEGVLSMNDFPLKAKQYVKKNFSREDCHRALDKKSVDTFKDFFLSEYCSIKEDGEYDFSLLSNYKGKHKYCFGLALFLMSYNSFGLAPIDILCLKQSEVVFFKNVETNRDFLKIETKRIKTGVDVRIVIDSSNLAYQLICYYLDCNVGKTTVMGIMDDVLNNEEKLYTKIASFENKANRDLKRVCKKLNVPNISLYYARHSAASHLNKNDVSLFDIASALGRSVNTIGTYISNLKTDDSLIRMANLF